MLGLGPSGRARRQTYSTRISGERLWANRGRLVEPPGAGRAILAAWTETERAGVGLYWLGLGPSGRIGLDWDRAGAGRAIFGWTGTERAGAQTDIQHDRAGTVPDRCGMAWVFPGISGGAGCLMAVWLDISGSVFSGFSVQLGPKTPPLDRRGTPRSFKLMRTDATGNGTIPVLSLWGLLEGVKLTRTARHGAGEGWRGPGYMRSTTISGSLPRVPRSPGNVPQLQTVENLMHGR